MKRFPWWTSHWVTYAFLVPAVVMLTLHHALHLSDALMVATPPGERDAHTFNLIMVGAFFGGIFGFLLHTGLVGYRSLSWVWVKLASVIAFWAGVAFLAM